MLFQHLRPDFDGAIRRINLTLTGHWQCVRRAGERVESHRLSVGTPTWDGRSREAGLPFAMNVLICERARVDAHCTSVDPGASIDASYQMVVRVDELP